MKVALDGATEHRFNVNGLFADLDTDFHTMGDNQTANINEGVGSTHPAASGLCERNRRRSWIKLDGDVDRCIAVMKMEKLLMAIKICSSW